MNNIDKAYTTLLQDILDNGVTKSDRTGTGTISVFGRQIRHRMSDGFPLLTTKRMAWKQIVTELLWFLRGDTNIKYLVDNDCHIWDGDAYKRFYNETQKGLDSMFLKNEGPNKIMPFTQEEFINKIKTDDEFAKKWGSLGKIYGYQWRNWGKDFKQIPNEEDNKVYHISTTGIDQIANLINNLKTNPDSRRLIVSAWNVGELDQMVLPPCHYGFQVYTRELNGEERWDLLKKKVGEERFKSMVDDIVPFGGGLSQELESYNIPQRAISLMWNQRSVDTFLGLPFNIASYGLLLEIIAKEVNMVPDELIGNLGDVHLYSNHVEQAKEQIGRKLTVEERMDWWFKNRKPNRDVCDDVDTYSPYAKGVYFDSVGVPKTTREPYPLPKLNFSWYIDNWNTSEAKEVRKDSFDAYIRQMRPSDFTLENYQSHPKIVAPLSN